MKPHLQSSIAGSEEGGANVAKGTDALSVLHNITTRDMFLNELRELECFVQQRIAEVSIEGAICESCDCEFRLRFDDLIRFSIPIRRCSPGEYHAECTGRCSKADSRIPTGNESRNQESAGNVDNPEDAAFVPIAFVAEIC